MRLKQCRVQNYRSIIDSGLFELESLKTILVGPNEAGKTVLLKAIQQLNKPDDIAGFEALRDYPRSMYNDITKGKVDPADVTVVTGIFELDDADKVLIPNDFHNCKYSLIRHLDNEACHDLIDAPPKVTFKDIKNDLTRMSAHMDKQHAAEGEAETEKPSVSLEAIIAGWVDGKEICTKSITALKKWLDDNIVFVNEDNEKEEGRHAKLQEAIQSNQAFDEVLTVLGDRVPVFILFSNYFRVKPTVHLEHLAQRQEQNILDDESYDYGNLCLLKLLGFTPRVLADLGNTKSPPMNQKDALKEYQDQLDHRTYQLNAASITLTKEICSAWMPNANRFEADKLKIKADGQYLKVVVEDDMGVEIELDQRSEGFQWMVSFFVVFFAEAMDKHDNAILLLDEPGMSLHGLKQREFRNTISRLAEDNQTVFSTHSPFLVGPDELDIVRVIELKDRAVGTVVHTTISSSDPAGLLPLQEALGYDLASSLFSQERNLILEGITDYWYIEATAQLLKEAKLSVLNDKIALVFANSAGKVVYYATILHAHNLKVAALLDSDSAGDQAAQQENLVHALGNKNILRTKDFCDGVSGAEIEDLLRETLIAIVKDEFGVDTSETAAQQSGRPIINLFEELVTDFSKYKLAKAYVRWTRCHEAKDLSEIELAFWSALVGKINKVLK